MGGKGTTNDWIVRRFSGKPVVTLGTTFAAPGAIGVDFPFYLPYRTYSAHAVGVRSRTMRFAIIFSYAAIWSGSPNRLRAIG